MVLGLSRENVTLAVAVLIVVLYTLSPIDAIPDPLPGGTVDDTLLGMALVYLFGPRYRD